jgi:signal transduction histidine kinase
MRGWKLVRRAKTERCVQFTRGGAPIAPVVMGVAVAAAVVSTVPAVRFHLAGPAAGAIVLTARGMTEMFAGYLPSQRFVRTASRVHFGVAVALGVMAVGDLGFVVVRATFTPDGGAAAVLPYQFAGAAVLAAAALAPRGTVARRPRRSMLLAPVAAVTAVLLVLADLGAIPSFATQPGADQPDMSGLRLATCALFALAAVALAANREARKEPLIKWLAVAACLGAIAQLERYADQAPTVPTFTWTHVFLLGVVVALLVGSFGEVRDYHRRLAEVAVADERRRLARDLHDGLAQEVAFIASQSRSLAVESGDERLDEIAVAAERALDDSRAVVGALTRARGLPLSASIALQAQEFARRWGLRVKLTLEPEVAVPPAKEQAILRIVGEALSNAARHAHASTIDIRLDHRDGPLMVAVSDDGRGFDPDAARMQAHGFGLRTMSERARLVGGEVRFVTEPGRGTRVEIAIP